MATHETEHEMTPEMQEHLHIHSFHDGDAVRWRDGHFSDEYEASERFILRTPRPDGDERCIIERIAPDFLADCHGHLPRATTSLHYIEHADDVDMSRIESRIAKVVGGTSIVRGYEAYCA